MSKKIDKRKDKHAGKKTLVMLNNRIKNMNQLEKDECDVKTIEEFNKKIRGIK